MRKMGVWLYMRMHTICPWLVCVWVSVCVIIWWKIDIYSIVSSCGNHDDIILGETACLIALWHQCLTTHTHAHTQHALTINEYSWHTHSLCFNTNHVFTSKYTHKPAHDAKLCMRLALHPEVEKHTRSQVKQTHTYAYAHTQCITTEYFRDLHTSLWVLTGFPSAPLECVHLFVCVCVCVPAPLFLLHIFAEQIYSSRNRICRLKSLIIFISIHLQEVFTHF